MSTYVFQLGQNKALSLAEVNQIISADTRYENGLAYFDRENSILNINEFGGLIRIAQIIKSGIPFESIEDIIVDAVTANAKKEHKYIFGISVLNNSKIIQARDLNNIGIRVKKLLRNLGYRVRYVNCEGRSNELTAGSVLKNGILKKGNEFILLSRNNTWTIGVTKSIQNVNEYAERDEGRPYRDSSIGMLPVKMAQIMVNLSNTKKGQALLDPFCGLGTILQEGLKKGIHVYGSDINKSITQKARKNLLWYIKNFSPPSNQFEIKHSDVKKIDSAWKTTFHSIVTEGFLGKPYHSKPSDIYVKKTISDLERIYIPFLGIAFSKLMKQGSRLVISWPFFPKNPKFKYVPWLDMLHELGYNQLDILNSYSNIPGYNKTRKSFLYSRKRAFVGREITLWNN